MVFELPVDPDQLANHLRTRGAEGCTGERPHKSESRNRGILDSAVSRCAGAQLHVDNAVHGPHRGEGGVGHRADATLLCGARSDWRWWAHVHDLAVNHLDEGRVGSDRQFFGSLSRPEQRGQRARQEWALGLLDGLRIHRFSPQSSSTGTVPELSYST